MARQNFHVAPIYFIRYQFYLLIILVVSGEWGKHGIGMSIFDRKMLPVARERPVITPATASPAVFSCPQNNLSSTFACLINYPPKTIGSMVIISDGSNIVCLVWSMSRKMTVDRFSKRDKALGAILQLRRIAFRERGCK